MYKTATGRALVVTRLPIASLARGGARRSLRPMAAGPTDRQETVDSQAGAYPEEAIPTDAIEAVNTADAVDTIENAIDTAIDTVDATDEAVAIVEPTTIVGKARSFVDANPMAGYPLLGIAGFMGITFVIAVVKTFAKGFTKQGKRTKTVNKNKLVIDELQKYLPDNRGALKGSAIAGIRLRTGFSPMEIFRKYLWFLLRERKFGPDCIEDLVELRSALKLSDEDVAAALKERAERIYKQYGTVMLDTTGLSQAGIERKATSRSLFSKMLYLVECEDMWSSTEFDRSTVSLRDIFGASEEDCARLRIASLYDIDLDKLMSSDVDTEDGDDGATAQD